MRRLNFYLTEQNIARLQAVARHEGVGMSEVLRDAIKQYKAPHEVQTKEVNHGGIKKK